MRRATHRSSSSALVSSTKPKFKNSGFDYLGVDVIGGSPLLFRSFSRPDHIHTNTRVCPLG